ncbi:unnamed protein product [Agarophyton chilense]
MAGQIFCRTLREHLELFLEMDKDTSWKDAVHEAGEKWANLLANGFYKTPGIDDVNLTVPETTGKPFSYSRNGEADSEAEIDVLTDMMEGVRTNISMDIGRILNASIDIAQVDEASVQELGWRTLQDFVRGSNNENLWLERKGFYPWLWHLYASGPCGCSEGFQSTDSGQKKRRGHYILQQEHR